MAVAALAVLGAVCLAVGVGLVYLPAGVIVAGLCLIAAAYIRRYLEAHGEKPARAPR